MREEGFYWVEYDGDWTVAEFTSFDNDDDQNAYGAWFGKEWCGGFDDTHFDEISDRRLNRPGER